MVFLNMLQIIWIIKVISSFYTVNWKQSVIIWVSLTEYIRVLQYTENVSLKIVYQLAMK